MTTGIDSSNVVARSQCRNCQSPLSTSVVDLGAQPPCEAYVASDKFYEPEPHYPLHAKVCDRCFLVQLDADVSPDSIYREYAYFSSYSDSWLMHARQFVDQACDRFQLNSKHCVVEVASNDGYLLKNFVERNIPCYGVDPAANVAKVAESHGVSTVVDFFGKSSATRLRRERGPADLIIANNVFGHVPDIHDFVAGFKALLSQAGTICIEIPHFLKQMENNQFDTIYHEHYLYHTLLADHAIFQQHELTIWDVDELTTHGGSMRLYIGHPGYHPEVSSRVQELEKRELDGGLDRLDVYRSFGEKVRETKRKLLSFLIDAKRSKKSIVGYGAPGKGNTLLNYCGIRTDFLDFVVDRNPYKQGKFLPGTRIPIFEPSRLLDAKPDYVLILPWNIKNEIIAQLAVIREWGGKFVVPIPEVQVIE